MGIEEEVDLMNKSFNEGINTDPPPTQAPGTNPPPTDPPGTDSPGTESPGTLAPGTEPPGTEAPTTEAPAEDSRFTALEEENRKLREKLAKKDEPKPTAAPSTEAPLVLDEVDFLDGVDLDDLTRDPKEFNKFLNKFYTRTVEEGRNLGTQRTLQAIPDIVANVVASRIMLQKASDTFYEENPDLVPFKKVVGTVAEELIANNPSIKYGDLVAKDEKGNPSMLEKEVRNRLELHRKATDRGKNTKPTPPRLPRKTGRSERGTGKPNLSPIESEIDKMNKSLGGNF